MSKKLFRFGKKAASTNTEKTPEQTPSSKWYRSIIDLPLNKFIECQVENNLSALIISGFPDKEELETAWVDIQQEYAGAIGDAQTKMHLTLLKEYTLFVGKYECVERLVNILSDVYSKELCGMLNTLLRTSFKFDHAASEEKYLAELESCRKRARSLNMQATITKSQIDAMEAKVVHGKPVTKEYYYSILITLGNHAGFHLTDTISVYEFAERITRFNKEADASKNK